MIGTLLILSFGLYLLYKLVGFYIKGRFSIIKEYARAILIAVLIAIILRSYIIQAFKTGKSAEELMPILGSDTYLMVLKNAYMLKNPQRGDIIFFEI